MSATPCPVWCESDHHGDPPDALSHWAAGETVPIDGETLCVDLVATGSDVPRVALTDSSAGPGWNVTLDEAERLQKALARVVAVGRGQGSPA